MTQSRDHRALLALAAILPQDDASAAAEGDDATGGEEVKTGRDFRRFEFSDRDPVRFLPSDLVEGLPLCDPVGADARPERVHLNAQVVQLTFQDLRSLIELKLRKAFGEDRLDLIQGMRLQQVQYHRIADDELAVDRFRVAGEALGQHG